MGSVAYPARFMLVLAANPCPCGKFSGRGRGCLCTSQQVRRYIGKLSGPLIDRIDLRVHVEPLSRMEMAQTTLGESSKDIRNRVVAARNVARQRFAEDGWALNSEITSRALRSKYQPERAGLNFLHNELEREQISARGMHKVIRLAWSIADLASHPRPTLADIEMAFTLREGVQR